MTDYSKIVRNDSEPENEDGFESWRDSLSEHDYNQHAIQYIEAGCGRSVVGVVKQDWINYRGIKQASIVFDMEGDFQDYLYGYYKKVILPNVDTGFVEPD